MKLSLLLHIMFDVIAISHYQNWIGRPCNCTVGRWYVNKTNKLKTYLINNKDALYM